MKDMKSTKERQGSQNVSSSSLFMASMLFMVEISPPS